MKSENGDINEESFWRKVDLSNPQHREHVVSLYDGSIYYADDALQKVLDLLQAKNIYDDTTVILISDHGERFYEHGCLIRRKIRKSNII